MINVFKQLNKFPFYEGNPEVIAKIQTLWGAVGLAVGHNIGLQVDKELIEKEKSDADTG